MSAGLDPELVEMLRSFNRVPPEDAQRWLKKIDGWLTERTADLACWDPLVDQVARGLFHLALSRRAAGVPAWPEDAMPELPARGEG